MGGYEVLKNAIQSVIKNNGREEITGGLLQDVLLSMVNIVGEGATYRGVATPATKPGTPDSRAFYLTATGGTYSNFGGIEVPDNQVGVFSNSTGTWRFELLLEMVTGLPLDYTDDAHWSDKVIIYKNGHYYALPLNNIATGFGNKTITGDKLADKTITTRKLADKTITGDKLADKTITTQKLADKTITGDKLADKTITGDKLADEVVGTRNIQVEAVTTEKLADAAVAGAKLSQDIQNSLIGIIPIAKINPPSEADKAFWFNHAKAGQAKMYYLVVAQTGSWVQGILQVLSDSLGHNVTLLYTSCDILENNVFTSHIDGAVNTYICHLSRGGHLPVGWTKWDVYTPDAAYPLVKNPTSKMDKKEYYELVGRPIVIFDRIEEAVTLTAGNPPATGRMEMVYMSSVQYFAAYVPSTKKYYSTLNDDRFKEYHPLNRDKFIFASRNGGIYQLPVDSSVVELTSSKAMPRYFNDRPKSCDHAFSDGKLRHWKATSVMEEGKPICDGHVLSFAWDNPGGNGADAWNSQLFIPNNSNAEDEVGAPMQFRTQIRLEGNTWGAWISLLDERTLNSIIRFQKVSSVWGENTSSVSVEAFDGLSITIVRLSCDEWEYPEDAIVLWFGSSGNQADAQYAHPLVLRGEPECEFSNVTYNSDNGLNYLNFNVFKAGLTHPKISVEQLVMSIPMPT